MWRRHGWRLLALGASSWWPTPIPSRRPWCSTMPRRSGKIPESGRPRPKHRVHSEGTVLVRQRRARGHYTMVSAAHHFLIPGELRGPRQWPAPGGYHWVNLALHEVNVALVYVLGILVLGEIAPALALAAIWGLHPLLTEAVTNIVGRADLLAAFGVLAGLLCT